MLIKNNEIFFNIIRDHLIKASIKNKMKKNTFIRQVSFLFLVN